MQKEPADGIVTAMVALDTIAPDGSQALAARLDALVARALPPE
ncbi:hypothetical protein [Streptomyces sp. NPDC048106]